ncbi:MAG: GIY-YIG nuclease family protein [Candidatus Methanosuratincola sp.]
MRGVYTIILRLNRDSLLKIGKKEFDLKPGVYVYVGSALGAGGINARLSRHFKTFTTGATKKHWHIDSLLPFSESFASVYALTSQKMECELVWSLKEMGFQTVQGFGNTDCRSRCGGHLILVDDLNVDLRSATQRVISAFEKIGLAAKMESPPLKTSL